ncbi:FxSxx-COOH system tetratricopeptide repeat protein [Frankia sp. Cr1]|uniref:FxSxx-COOH system tetratricopeptide repeat protein n=1 Tax=Frankia sp. Cr1 TaxID=3073931 RepID=UPI002AD28838|nr:FxSxx-COOH system tetratricopeptide repeat protein [Frankia sp. Cr1]
MSGESGTGASGQRWEVALSFAGAQRAYVERVAAALKARGVRCFYDADEQLELWGRYLAEELPDIYAEQAAAVVVFVSADYASRDWTRLERRAALNRAVRERREYVLPARFDDTPLPGLLSDLVAIDLRGRDPEQFVELVATKLTALGILSPDRNPQPSQPSSGPGPAVLPAVWNVPGRLATFTGRRQILDRIASTFASNVGGLAAVALHGLGAVGKTQLAIEHAWQHAADYRLVWWVSAEQATLIGDQLAALAPHLDLPVTGTATDAYTVLTALARRDDWILIFDNVEVAADLRPWLPASVGGHVLITSRSPVWGAMATPVEIDVFTRDEAAGFLQRRIHGLDAELAAELADELGGLPLALEQTAGYLEATGTTTADYLTRFRSRRATMLARGEDLAYGGTIDTCWSLALERLRTTTPAAIQLLELAAYLGPEPIPLSWFTPDHLDEPLRTVAIDDDLDDVVAAIRRYGLARRVDASIILHRLVQVVVRTHLRTDHAATTAARVRDLLAAAMPPGDFRDPAGWQDWAALAAHVLAAPALHTEAPTTDTDTGLRRLLLTTADYLRGRGDYRTSHQLNARLHQQWAVTLGNDHPDTLTAASDLARGLAALGDYRAARALDEDTLARRRRVLGEDHRYTLKSASNLAIRLAAVGNLEAARALDEDTLARRTRVLGNDHRDTLESMNNLAFRLRTFGDLNAARALDEDTLARKRRLLGEDHPSTLLSASNLAADLRALGNLDAARGLDEETLARRRWLLGDDHPDTLTSATRLALDLSAIGEIQAARALDEDTLARRQRLFGDDHPDTLESAFNLARGLAALGDYRAARALDEDTLARRRLLFGDDHRHSLRSAYSLACVLEALGDHLAARALATDTLIRQRRTLGDEHRSTRETEEFLCGVDHQSTTDGLPGGS